MKIKFWNREPREVRPQQEDLHQAKRDRIGSEEAQRTSTDSSVSIDTTREFRSTHVNNKLVARDARALGEITRPHGIRRAHRT